MALSALTAWQALVDQAQLQLQEKVLVAGGSGGVGVCAVQVARALGAEVAVSGSESGREMVSRLGAGQYLDYTAGLVDQVLPGFDVVVDAAGAGVDEALYRVLSPGSRLILGRTGTHSEPDSPAVRRAHRARKR